MSNCNPVTGEVDMGIVTKKQGEFGQMPMWLGS